MEHVTLALAEVRFTSTYRSSQQRSCPRSRLIFATRTPRIREVRIASSRELTRTARRRDLAWDVARSRALDEYSRTFRVGPGI